MMEQVGERLAKSLTCYMFPYPDSLPCSVVNFSFVRFDVEHMETKKLDCMKRGWTRAGRGTGEAGRGGWECKGVGGRGRNGGYESVKRAK